MNPAEPETKPALDVAELRRNPPQVLDVPECAVFINVSEKTVRRLVEERKIPFIKVRGRVLFVSSKVIAALERMAP